jgi:hypothetical protein
LRRKQVQVGKAEKLRDDNSSIYALESAEHSHRYAVEEEGKGHKKNMRRICENACDFAPAEHFIVLAIGVGITAPIISKVLAIRLALLIGEKPDIFGRGRDEKDCGQPEGGSEGSLLNQALKDM